MELKNICELLEKEAYDELILELNRGLLMNQNDPMLYYYRFLAYNHDYKNMDYDDLLNEVDLNKAFDLEEEYSYEAEYNFFKALDKEKRELFLNALRGNEKEVAVIGNRLTKSNSFLTKRILRLLNAYTINLTKASELRLTKDALMNVLSNLRDLDEKEEKLLEEFNVIVKYLDNKLELFDEARFLIKDGVLLNVSPKTAKKVIIPAEVRVLSPNLFSGFKALSEIIVPDGVEEVGMDCFKDCTSLSKVILPKTIKKVFYPLFSGCSSLRELTLPLVFFYDGKYRYNLGHYFGTVGYIDSSEVKQVLNSSGKKSYQAYYIPKSLSRLEILEDTLGFQNIEWYTFYGCHMLKEIILPKGIKKIGAEAFSGCTSLSSLNIPESVTTIDVDAFKNCKALKRITIPNGITSFTYPVFSGCSSLEDLTMPMKCFYDGKYKYNLGLYFGSKQFENSIYTVQYVRRNKRDLQEGYYLPRNLYTLTLTPGIESSSILCKSVLEGIKSLKKVVLPKNLSEIGEYTFRDCIALEDINIPESVTTIRSFAFIGCSSLRRVVLPSAISNVGETAFTNKAKIYIKRKKPMFSLPEGFKTNWCESGTEVIWDYKG